MMIDERIDSPGTGTLALDRPRHGLRARGLRPASLALVLAVTLAGCRGEPAFLRQAHKEELIGAIERTLLASVEAEKIAVLTSSEEEAQQAASATRELTAEADRLRAQLAGLVAEDARPAEVESLDAFDVRWKELTTVDERLLALALSNTNLKAARLSARDGLAAVDRLVGALETMQRASDDPATIRLLGDASVAALREEVLLLIHVPSADDAEMTRLEERMDALATTVEATLAVARTKPGLPGDALEAASSAWSDYRRIAAEVIRLSRENSDVRSHEVSVHDKRKVTRECLEALTALLAAVESGPQPVR